MEDGSREWCRRGKDDRIGPRPCRGGGFPKRETTLTRRSDRKKRVEWLREREETDQQSDSPNKASRNEKKANGGSELQLFGYAFSRSSVRPLHRGREAGRTGATMVVHHDGGARKGWNVGDWRGGDAYLVRRSWKRCRLWIWQQRDGKRADGAAVLYSASAPGQSFSQAEASRFLLAPLWEREQTAHEGEGSLWLKPASGSSELSRPHSTLCSRVTRLSAGRRDGIPCI